MEKKWEIDLGRIEYNGTDGLYPEGTNITSLLEGFSAGELAVWGIVVLVAIGWIFL